MYSAEGLRQSLRETAYTMQKERHTSTPKRSLPSSQALGHQEVNSLVRESGHSGNVYRETHDIHSRTNQPRKYERGCAIPNTNPRFLNYEASVYHDKPQ